MDVALHPARVLVHAGTRIELPESAIWRALASLLALAGMFKDPHLSRGARIPPTLGDRVLNAIGAGVEGYNRGVVASAFVPIAVLVRHLEALSLLPPRQMAHSFSLVIVRVLQELYWANLWA